MLRIHERPSALFFGAGVATGCGGPSGNKLLEAVKHRFNEAKADRLLNCLEEVINLDNSNRKEVEDFVKGEVGAVSAGPEQKYLFSLPWRALLTTNYDSLPETIGESLDGSRTVIPMADPETEGKISVMRNDLLYCFKLMGSSRYSFPVGGWMVLSSGDLSLGAERRRRFFQVFRELSSSGHIIYLGYSFEDGVVLNLLKEMNYILRELPWKGFAITPTQPREDVLRAMRSLGVEWVQGDLTQFVSEAKKIFDEVPQSSPAEIQRLSVHGVPIQLDRATVANIAQRFVLLDNNMLESRWGLDPRMFVYGNDDSFYPYVRQWDFPRRARTVWAAPKPQQKLPGSLPEFSERWKNTNSSDNLIAVLVGGAGAGKSVAARRVAFDWYQTGNPVVFVEPDVLMLDAQALEGLLDEIWNKYLAEAGKIGLARPAPLRFLIVADDGVGHLDELVALKNRLRGIAKPADLLLVARKSEAPMDELRRSQIDLVFELDDTVLPQEWGRFEQHFGRLGVLEKQEVLSANLREPEINSSFFALVYSSVRGLRVPLATAVAEEYERLDIDAQKVYALVSLLQSLLLKPWTAMTARSVGLGLDALDAEMHSKLGGVLTYREGQNILSAPNRLLADIVRDVAFRTPADRYVVLKGLVENVQPDTLEEVNLLHSLLTDQRRFEAVSLNLGDNQKVELYTVALERVPSRPLFLHLAMTQMDAGRLDDARSSLNKAKNAKVRSFHEPDHHVFDAEGRLELRLAEASKKAGDVEGGMEHLSRAEQHFDDAIGLGYGPASAPHSYQGLGRTYVMMSELASTNAERWRFLLYATQELVFAENALGEWANPPITLLKLDVLRLLGNEELDKSKVEQITDAVGRANGYAFMALREMSRASYGEALKLVERGLNEDRANLWLIRLHVQLAKSLTNGDWEARRVALRDYEPLAAKKFDVTLTFELAMQKYADGDPIGGDRLFKTLGERARNHPMYLTPSEENRWKESGRPRTFTGTLIEVPAGPRDWGRIDCPNFPRPMPVRRKELMWADPQGGERVSFEIIFNMAGPQASRVRAVTR